MNVKNESVTLINICGKYIVPNQTVPIDDSFKDHPVINNYVKANIISIQSDSAKTIQDADSTHEEFEKLLENGPSLAALKRFAKKYGIGLDDAKTEEEIIAVINASVAVSKLGA